MSIKVYVTDIHSSAKVNASPWKRNTTLS